MKKLVKILVLLLSINSFAQVKTIEYQDQNQEKCEEKNANFKITKITFKDGISSEEKFDLKEKQIIHIKNFKNKIKQGKFIYYEYGKISSEINFENDLLTGDLKIYDEKGKLKRTLNYDKARAFMDSQEVENTNCNDDNTYLNLILIENNFYIPNYISKEIYINDYSYDERGTYTEYITINLCKNGTIKKLRFLKNAPKNFQLEITRVLIELRFKSEYGGEKFTLPIRLSR